MRPSAIRMGPPRPELKGAHPVHVHPPKFYHRFFAVGLGASMWFFLMYRAKKDMPALLGWKHPWEH